MLTHTDSRSQVSAVPEAPKAGTYSPVTVHQEDTVGAVFLGIVALSLLFAFLRSEARNRALLAQLAALRPTLIEAAPRDGRGDELPSRPATASQADGVGYA